MANMIKFYKGLEASLPAVGTNGALYITTDEGAIYLGTGTGMKRLGDFVQVANVASLPAKAHESCLYYCVAENILAKWNGTEWKQINKQPTAEELKTLLGLGSMAYVSEVAEDNLSSALKEKVNAAAEGNHSHSNKDVLDGITAEKVSAWDAAEGNAKGHADGLNTAMDTRVKAVEAAIGENGSVAGQIKTAIEALDFTDTAVDGEYVSAVNEVDGKISVTRKALPDYSNTYDAKGAADTAFENAKAYADGLAANYDEKGAAAGVKTELTTEINKKVDKVEGKDLISTSEITRLASVTNYDDTQVKADIAKKADSETMTTELGKKVDKVDGYSLVSDTEITKLAGVSEGATKVEKSDTNGNIKVDGEEVTVYELPETPTFEQVHVGTAWQNGGTSEDGALTISPTSIKSRWRDEDGSEAAWEIGYTRIAHRKYAPIGTDEWHDVSMDSDGLYVSGNEGETYVGQTVIQTPAIELNGKDLATELDSKASQSDYEALAGQVGTVPEGQTVMGIIANIQENAYDDTELRGLVNSKVAQSDYDVKVKALEDAIATKQDIIPEKTYDAFGAASTAESNAKGYVDQKFTDANLGQYTTEQEVKDIVDGVIAGAADSETYNSLTKLVDYIDTHGGEATKMAEAIDTLEGKVETIEDKPAYGITATQISNWDGEVGAKALAETKTTTAEVKTQIEAYGYATEADLTLAEGRITTLEGKSHTHTNDTVLDGITAEKVSSWDGKADKTYVDGINGQVNSNVTNITNLQEEVGKKANSADVYAKTETYTKSEVEALLTWGSF